MPSSPSSGPEALVLCADLAVPPPGDVHLWSPSPEAKCVRVADGQRALVYAPPGAEGIVAVTGAGADSADPVVWFQVGRDGDVRWEAASEEQIASFVPAESAANLQLPVADPNVDEIDPHASPTHDSEAAGEVDLRKGAVHAADLVRHLREDGTPPSAIAGSSGVIYAPLPTVEADDCAVYGQAPEGVELRMVRVFTGDPRHGRIQTADYVPVGGHYRIEGLGDDGTVEVRGVRVETSGATMPLGGELLSDLKETDRLPTVTVSERGISTPAPATEPKSEAHAAGAGHLRPVPPPSGRHADEPPVAPVSLEGGRINLRNWDRHADEGDAWVAGLLKVALSRKERTATEMRSILSLVRSGIPLTRSDVRAVDQVLREFGSRLEHIQAFSVVIESRRRTVFAAPGEESPRLALSGGVRVTDGTLRSLILAQAAEQLRIGLDPSRSARTSPKSKRAPSTPQP